MARLTKLEKEMLRRSGEFVLAGEWPWEDRGNDEETRKEKREKVALISAIAKMEG